jgi:hypothetical protein
MASLWSRPRIAAGIGVLLAAAGVAVLAVSANTSAKASGPTPSPAVMSHYSVFARAATNSDPLPAASLVAEPQAAEESTITRRLTQSGATDTTEWATLNGEQICVIARSTPSDGLPDTNRACVAAAELEAQHQLLLQLSLVGSTSSTPPEAGLANVISGLAPDGVTTVTLDFADGTEETVPVTENGFIDRLSSPKMLQHLTWTSPAGQTISGQ